jgi:hypothetical protein
MSTLLRTLRNWANPRLWRILIAGPRTWQWIRITVTLASMSNEDCRWVIDELHLDDTPTQAHYRSVMQSGK